MKAIFLWLFPPASVRYATRRERHLHDALFFVLSFILALAVSFPLSTLVSENNHFSMAVFILVVAVIARFTSGFAYSIAASLTAVWCVNYIFTFPYWSFNMSLVGYPLNFAAMLIVSMMISALTAQNKRQAQLQLEAEMEKTRANLLRSVSHDLRTPLTAIIGSSSLLLEQPRLSHEEQHELLSSIYHDARWLAQITQNILSITKFSNGKVELKLETEVLEEIVSSAIGKFRKHHTDVAVTVHRPDEILLVQADATLIEQVLLNLLDNAVIHGVTTRSIHIHLCSAKNEILIVVEDDGQGIAESVLPRLFDGANTSSCQPDAKRNMGIGLSVCRTIITAHSGKISAANTPAGAKFTFTLPASKE